MLDLLIFGDINKVLTGRVTQNSLMDIDLSLVPYALGSGSNGNWQVIGETIIFNSEAHIYIPPANDKITKILHTPFLMGVSRRPNDVLKLERKILISDLYQELLVKYSKGFAIVGEALFESLDVSCLKCSPIYKENINTNKDKYWEQETHQNMKAKIVGIVLPYLHQKAFYKNPLEKAESPIYSHTHALTSLGARHLLTQSMISEASFYIESIS